MRKIILTIVIAAVLLSVFGCKKNPDEQDRPGYVPPDLSYPGNDNISTDAGGDLPFDTNPTTEGPAIITPGVTDPDKTETEPSTPAVTDTPDTEAPTTATTTADPPEVTDPEETEPKATEAPETKPAETEDEYVVPDVIVVPTEIPYVITSEAGYHEFIYNPDADYFSSGVNIYYTVPGEEGVIHMNKLDSYGFMKYIGEYSGSQYDLDLELIEYVLSGELQDELVSRKLDPQIWFVGGVATQSGYLPRFIWVNTPEDDYFVTFGKNEGEILVCTREDFFKLFE